MNNESIPLVVLFQLVLCKRLKAFETLSKNKNLNVKILNPADLDKFSVIIVMRKIS